MDHGVAVLPSGGRGGWGLAGEEDRAFRNLAEAMPLFIGLALPLQMQDAPVAEGLTGAWVFVGARVLYVPAYLSAVPGLRSTVWLAGHAGLGVMAWAALA